LSLHRACPKSGDFGNWLGGAMVTRVRRGSYLHFGGQ
jgi:hypothetical protein